MALKKKKKIFVVNYLYRVRSSQEFYVVEILRYLGDEIQNRH